MLFSWRTRLQDFRQRKPTLMTCDLVWLSVEYTQRFILKRAGNWNGWCYISMFKYIWWKKNVNIFSRKMAAHCSHTGSFHGNGVSPQKRITLQWQGRDCIDQCPYAQQNGGLGGNRPRLFKKVGIVFFVLFFFFPNFPTLLTLLFRRVIRLDL